MPKAKKAPTKAKPAAAAESSSSSEQAAITQQEEAGWRTASQEEAKKEKERRPKRQKHKEDLQLPLLPGHLIDKHLYMYTVGCKGEHTMRSILASYGVPRRKTLLIDCRDLDGGQ